METTGLILDRKLINARQSSWVDALNMVRNNTNDTIDVEDGFSTDELCIETTYPIIGRISANNEYVLLCGDGYNSQIVSNRKGIIIDDPLLGFNPLFPINGVSEYNHKGELVIAYTDYNLSPKILNIDNLPFEINEDFSLTDKSKLTLLDLSPVVTEPNIVLESVTSGGNLKSGVYYLTTAYGYSDESITPWLYKHNPISIIDESNLSIFKNIDGCKAGTVTNKAINCVLSNLDFNFDYVYIGVIVKINNIVEAFKYGKYDIDKSGVPIRATITDLNTSTPVSLTEMFTQNAIYTKVKTIASLDKELLLGNVVGLPLLDFQQYVNDIKVSWIRDKAISLDGFKGSYKDPVTIYSNKTFRAGEVIGILIGLKLKQTGTYALYHIPGRFANTGDKDVVTDPYVTDLDSTIYKFQLNDTSTVNPDGISGDMGYWENRNEVYPPWFPSDSNDNVFAGTNVRHHRMPSLSALHSYGQKFVEGLNSTDETQSLALVANSFTPTQGCTFSSVLTPVLGVYNSTKTAYTANVKQNVEVVIDFETEFVDPASPGNITFKLNIYNAANAIIEEIENRQLIRISKTHRLNKNYHIILEEGQYVKYTVTAGSNIKLTKMYVDLNITKYSSVIQGSLKTTALGLKLENIVIPDSIMPYIDGVEIFYYERDNSNMTIIDQDGYNAKNKRYPNQINFHGFSTVSNQINPSPSYISLELELTANTATITDPDTGTVNKYDCMNDDIGLPAGRKLTLVKDITYVPANNNATKFDNLAKEDCFVIETRNDIPSVLGKVLLYNICAYKTDMYFGFLNRRVVSTGLYFKIDSSKNEQEAIVVYGGDTFIGQYAYLTYSNAVPATHIDFDKSFTRNILSFPCESTSNINFRYEGLNPYEKYYPKTDITEITYHPVGPIWDGVFTKMWQYGNSYLYNTDYNSVNNITAPRIWNNSKNFIVRFPHRIHRTLPMNSESTELKWRIIPSLNYYDMPYNKGEIVKLLGHGKALFIGMRNATFKAFVKDLLSMLNTDAYLSKGDIFDRDPSEIIDSVEGVIGVQNQECMISTPFGVFVLDRVKAKAYLLNEAIVPLNPTDIYEYLKEHLTFNEEYVKYNILLANISTYIQASTGTALLWSDPRTPDIVNSIDNIYIDKGVILGYEMSDKNRLFITAKNKDFYPTYTISSLATLLGKEESEIGHYPSALRINVLTGNLNSIIIQTKGFVFELNAGSAVGLGTFITYPDAAEQAISLKDSIILNFADAGIDDEYDVKILGTYIYIVAKTTGSTYNLTANDITGTNCIVTAESLDFIVFYDRSFTLSYNYDSKYWESRHSFLPVSYVQLRKGTYAVTGHRMIASNKVYNINNGIVGKYSKYDTDILNIINGIQPTFPSFIDFAYNFKDGVENYLISAVKWISRAYLHDKLQRVKTFESLMVYSTNQCTNYIPLIHVDYKQAGSLEFNNDGWYCNTIRDMLLASAEFDIFLDKDNQPIAKYFHDGEVTELIPGNEYMIYNVSNPLTDNVTYNSRVMNYNGARFIATTDTSYTISGIAKIKNIKKWFDISEINTKFTAIRLYTSNIDSIKLMILQIAPLIKSVL